jgi:hypothetical protein
VTASHVIYEGPDYRPFIPVVLGLLGIVGVYLLYDLGAKVREKRKKSRWLDARVRQAQADARTAEAKADMVAPPQGRHSGPMRAVPDSIPRDWMDEWLRREEAADYDEGDR